LRERERERERGIYIYIQREREREREREGGREKELTLGSLTISLIDFLVCQLVVAVRVEPNRKC
jgi:hypothetical protein